MEIDKSNTTNPSNEAPNAVRNKYLARLLPVIKQRGFSHLRIDDIVRSMDISKATFYKHFSSKEEIIELVVEMIIGYLKQMATQLEDEAAPYVQRFQHIFGQSLLLASYLSDTFLLDLRQVFPSLWERLKQAQQERQRYIQRFYEQGLAAAVFQPINPILVVLQDELMLGNIISPIFLVEHNLTLHTLLYDYYTLQKYQWLVPEARSQVDDTPVKDYIDMMARKISLRMHVDT